MPNKAETLEARVRIDDKFKAKLARRKNGKYGLGPLVEELKNKGHKEVTRHFISQIISPNRDYPHNSFVSYQLYVDVVGEEPEDIIWREPSQLVEQIATCHCYFFGVKKSALAKEVAEEAKKYGLDYDPENAIMGMIIKHNEKLTVNPIITDIVADKFRKANGVDYSLAEIEKLVNEFDEMPVSETPPDSVSWDIARPIIEDSIRLSGRSFRSLVPGYARSRLEAGKEHLKVKEYLRLRRELHEIPQYRELFPYRSGLAQELTQMIGILQSTGLDSLTELELVNQGKKNYGERTFMEHIFPAYMAIKQEHNFPSNCFGMVVRVPEETNGKYEGDILAARMATALQEHKTRVLDNNKRLGLDRGVTADGITSVISEATGPLYQTTLRRGQYPSLSPLV